MRYFPHESGHDRRDSPARSRFDHVGPSSSCLPWVVATPIPYALPAALAPNRFVTTNTDPSSTAHAIPPSESHCLKREGHDSGGRSSDGGIASPELGAATRSHHFLVTRATVDW